MLLEMNVILNQCTGTRQHEIHIILDQCTTRTHQQEMHVFSLYASFTTKTFLYLFSIRTLINIFEVELVFSQRDSNGAAQENTKK